MNSAQSLSVYLEAQRERVGCAELRRRGLPRGSGGIRIREQVDLPRAPQALRGLRAPPAELTT
jgi:hypothetical protein